MQGGLPLAVVVSLPLLRALGLPFGAFWDLATLVTLIWLIFGRLGCLLHGCCGGRPTRGWLGLELPDHRGIRCRRVPTQIMEAGWAALLLLTAVGLWGHRPFPGAVFLAAAGAYGLARVTLQPARQVQDRLGAVNLQRAFAAALGVLALLGLLVAWLANGRST
jgi:phosphatidylglycerol:prolipoprotein diacylglycerol transferase